jgi:hypothetical protein
MPLAARVHHWLKESQRLLSVGNSAGDAAQLAKPASHGWICGSSTLNT